ncbi:MAG: homocysteine S-methyltransferase family protein, partial [Oscillospiraceae bacterium]|nr:homocysteine S-methyltransferase family protein [Oscillospiraceae bacterium]
MVINFPLILDGATGTELQKKGLGAGDCAEAWILAHPEIMQSIQREYVRAGSQVIYAPTFGANRVKLEAHGIFHAVEDYNRRLVALSREAAGERALVAGDLAPTGHFLYPLGDLTFEELVNVYTEQAAALENAGVDLFVIETMMTVAEARAAVLAVRSVSRKPVFVTFTCDENGRTLTGSDITAVLQIMQGMEIDAFGLNCSVGPEEMVLQIQRLYEHASVPLIAKPNAGLPEMQGDRTVYSCSPEQFAACLRDMAEAGIRIFGGCCGTTAEHIAALRAGTAPLSPAPIAPQHTDRLPAATEKELFYLDCDAAIGDVITCSEDLEDNLLDAADGDAPVIALAIQNAVDMESFAECQYMIRKPLCLVCDSTGLLESALRLYQGRALYWGPLTEEDLAPL